MDADGGCRIGVKTARMLQLIFNSIIICLMIDSDEIRCLIGQQLCSYTGSY